MTLMEQLQSSKLTWYDGRSEDLVKWNFYKNSYRVDENYVFTKDSMGRDVILPFHCHEKAQNREDYKLRQDRTPVVSYCPGIINKYVGAVFRQPIQRPDTEFVNYLISNADGFGNTLDDLMQEELTNAMLYGRSYFVTTFINEVAGDISPVQLREMNNAPILRPVPILSVVGVSELDNGQILEFAFIYETEEGIFLRVYDRTDYCDALINIYNGGIKILEVGDVKAHLFPDIPVVKIEPKLGNTFIAPLADNQKHIANQYSLLFTETNDHVYTKNVISGDGIIPEDLDGTKKMELEMDAGSKRTLLFNKPVSIASLSGNPGTSESIRKNIEMLEEAMYLVAGLQVLKGNTSTSGISKLIEREDFHILANIFRMSCQAAENKMLMLYGIDEKVWYPDQFIEKDWQKEINELRDILAITEIPEEIKQKAVEEFRKAWFA
jgi:hypothetical protein